MPIQKVMEGTISADYEYERDGIVVAKLTLLRIPAVPPAGVERRHYTYREGTAVEWGEIPQDDERSDDDIVNDVFFTRGKPAGGFERKL